MVHSGCLCENVVFLIINIDQCSFVCFCVVLQWAMQKIYLSGVVEDPVAYMALVSMSTSYSQDDASRSLNVLVICLLCLTFTGFTTSNLDECLFTSNK